MQIDILTVATWLASIIVATLIGALIDRWMQAQPKVICFIGHSAFFKVKAQKIDPFDFATHSLILRNSGRCVAKEVQIIHGILPDNFEVSPGIDWGIRNLEDGARAIIFPTLLPGEQATISYMYPPIIQSKIHTGVRHQDGLVKVIQVLPVRVYPPVVYWFLVFLIVSGAVAILAFLLFLFLPSNFHFSFI